MNFKRNAIHLSLSVGALILVAACAPSSSPKSTSLKISAGIVANSNLPPAQKAEELAKQAEQLLTAQGFLQALDVADLALKQDPQNFRAGLIKAYLGTVMEMKGIVVRLRPLAERNPKALENYKKTVAQIQNEEPESSLKKFLFDGQPDIKTETDLQLHLDRMSQALQNFREFLKANKTAEITVRANSALVPDLAERFVSACEIKETANLEYELICPPSESRYDITLNQADLAYLRDQASFLEIVISAYNAYDVTGAIDVAASMNKSNPQKIKDRLFQNKKFGLIRNQQTLPKIKELALDYAAGLRWAMANQSTLCPRGYPDPQNRPGKLNNKGTCVNSYFQPYIDSLESIMKGEVQTLESERNGKSHKTQMKPTVLLDQPISDLRSLNPTKIDRCAQILEVGDPTFGGVFPNGDANIVLPLRIEECK